MKINLYCIAKENRRDDYISQYQKMCRGFGGELEVIHIFSPAIAKAQKTSSRLAQLSYTQAFLPFVNAQGRNIALDVGGRSVDSFGFSKLLDSAVVNFFIGGAYGFEEMFLKQMQTLSLSTLTFGHRVVKMMLCEQVYRALSLINHHPYHK